MQKKIQETPSEIRQITNREILKNQSSSFSSEQILLSDTLEIIE